MTNNYSNEDYNELVEGCVRSIANSSIDHKKGIMAKRDIKEAHAYCKVACLSGQKTGPLIETYLINFKNFKKNDASDCNGDYSDNMQTNNELKVSLGGSNHNKFNYVQLRPSHKIDYYILTAYHLSIDNMGNCGELYIFKISKKDIIPLIVEYGGYAHGTVGEHGVISKEHLENTANKREYTLRPTYNNKLWKKLLVFRITETEL